MWQIYTNRKRINATVRINGFVQSLEVFVETFSVATWSTDYKADPIFLTRDRMVGQKDGTGNVPATFPGTGQYILHRPALGFIDKIRV